VRQIFNIDAMFAQFTQENVFGFPIVQHPYVHDPQMCRGSNLVNTLRNQALGNSIWISLLENNNQVAATTIDFEYNENENCVVGIKIFTFCSGYGYGSRLMEIIKMLATIMIDTRYMFARDNEDNSYITLNPTETSLPFYLRNGFEYDEYNNICSIRILSEVQPEQEQEQEHYSDDEYYQKYLNLKNKLK
jgi:hypothetical protein